MDQIAHILNTHVGGILDDFTHTQTQDEPQDFFSSIKTAEETIETPVPSQNSVPEQQIDITKIKSSIADIQNQLDNLLRLLDGQSSPSTLSQRPKITSEETSTYINGEQIIEGVFNGEKFIGSDGQEYSVPQNYASKSKLVEGDIMKLTIRRDGKFIYKQIGPIDRKRVIGILNFNEETQIWCVTHQEKDYKILTASATFYKGKPGDEVIILLPKDCDASWGAVENIIK